MRNCALRGVDLCASRATSLTRSAYARVPCWVCLPRSPASMIWIIGEYADRIDNAHELLEQLTANFEEDSVNVR